MSFCSKALAPVHVLLGLGKFLGAESQMLLIDIANGDDVFAGERVEMSFGPAPGADQGDVQLVARRIRPKKFDARQDQPAAPVKAVDLRNWRRLMDLVGTRRDLAGVFMPRFCTATRRQIKPYQKL